MSTDKPRKPSLLSKTSDAFERLAKREQNLIFVSVPITIVVVMFLLVIEPEMKKIKRLQTNYESAQNELMLSKESSKELFEQAKLDPDVALKQQIESLEAKLNNLNQQFDGELNQLVTPQAMPGLLKDLFDRATGLSLLSMKSMTMPPIELSEEFSNEDQARNNETPKIFRHGITITFEGSFFATRDFLSSAENLRYKLYWQDLSYSVSEHPKALTQITLFTLSTSEAFIGVY